VLLFLRGSARLRPQTPGLTIWLVLHDRMFTATTRRTLSDTAPAWPERSTRSAMYRRPSHRVAAKFEENARRPAYERYFGGQASDRVAPEWVVMPARRGHCGLLPVFCLFRQLVTP